MKENKKLIVLNPMLPTKYSKRQREEIKRREKGLLQNKPKRLVLERGNK